MAITTRPLRRTDVLDVLRTADGPLGFREVAQRVGLHSNTARFHLEAPVEAGMAVRGTEDREVPGRPRIGYRAAVGSPAGARRYRLLAAIMAELGFAPQPEPGDAGRYRLDLQHCPFREVAERHKNVICSLHLGMMRGALARMRAPLGADRLDPFVEPGLCVARLTEAAGRPEAAQA